MEIFFKRIDTTQMAPFFLRQCIKLVENCAKRGYIFYAISGPRTFEEQLRLYNQGRTTSGKIVTNAKPGESLHNFGLAIDFCRDKDITKEGLQPDWDIESYKVIQEEAHKLGLVSGLDFKSFPEGPHIQIKLNIPLKKLEELYKKEGIEAVWNLLNQS